jgi:hypothetical protein
MTYSKHYKFLNRFSGKKRRTQYPPFCVIRQQDFNFSFRRDPSAETNFSSMTRPGVERIGYFMIPRNRHLMIFSFDTQRFDALRAVASSFLQLAQPDPKTLMFFIVSLQNIQNIACYSAKEKAFSRLFDRIRRRCISGRDSLPHVPAARAQAVRVCWTASSTA